VMKIEKKKKQKVVSKAAMFNHSDGERRGG
jgi:hypothetical protein